MFNTVFTIKYLTDIFYLYFQGGRQAEEIVSWLLKKTGPPATQLNNKAEADAFKEKADVVVIGFIKVVAFNLYFPHFI